MTRSDTTDPVGDQYEQWVYPRPVADLAEIARRGHYAADPSQMHRALWPDRDGPPDGMRILVAGCGANEAASYAHNNPDARVVGIDLSESSLAHERHLKDRHRLDNLALHRMRLEEVAELGTPFDLVIASGVLHHTPEPAMGLRALGETLSPEGVVMVMVYGRYGRTGVYMLQDLFSRLGAGRTADDLALVKATLPVLPANHPIKNYLDVAHDLDFDGGLVDTFLHARDVAYTVDGALALVDEAGLAFQTWMNNGLYWPDARLGPAHPLRARLDALDEPARWAAMELVNGVLAKHTFLACRRDRPERAYRVDFSREDALEFRPIQHLRALRPDAGGPGAGTVIEQSTGPEIRLTEAEARVFALFDGTRTIAACLRDLGGEDTVEREGANAVAFAERMWRSGVVLIGLPGVEAERAATTR